MVEASFAWQELRVMASLMWAMVLNASFYSLMFPTALAFCSGLGTELFDSASLAITLFQTIVVSASSGVRWGCLPLFSQTIGAGSNQRRMGTQIQRAIITGICLSAVSVSLMLNSGKLLLLVGQLPHLAANAELFLICMIPGSICIMTFRVLVAVTDSLGIVIPIIFVHALGFLVNLLLQYISVSVLKLGLIGSGLSLSCSLILMLVAQIAYIVCSGVCSSYWTSWSWKSLGQMKKFLNHILPSVGFSVLEFFGFEMGSFLAGGVGVTTLAAHSILFQVLTFANYIPVGLEGAAISRIAYHLGQGHASKAKLTFGLGVAIQSLIAIATVAVLAAMVHELPKIFSAEAATVELYMQSFPLLLVFVVLTMLTYAMVAGMRAVNYHMLALVVTLICFYPVYLGVAFILLYTTSLGLFGIWLAYIACMLLQTLSGTVVMLRVDWNLRSQVISDDAGNESDCLQQKQETAPLLLHSSSAAAGQEVRDGAEQKVNFRHVRGRFIAACAVIVLLPAGALLIRLFLPTQILMQPILNSTLINDTVTVA